jgi:hypothetical protein
MRSSPHEAEKTQLALGFSVSDYKAARDAHDSQKISEAIRQRFTERYIRPATDPVNKHGFTIIAISCLMIEALESFHKGWESTSGKSETAFRSFFGHTEPFKQFRGHEGQFYKHIRCGILHQAETTGGWKIIRTGALFDEATLTINATRFIRSLDRALNEFCDVLKAARWDSAEWTNVCKKMNAICENCV